MKKTLPLILCVTGLLFASCSRYEKDVTYKQSMQLNAQAAMAGPSASADRAVAALEVKPQAMPTASLHKFSPLKEAKRLLPSKVTAIAATVGHKSMKKVEKVIAYASTSKQIFLQKKKQDVHPGGWAGKGLFLMLLSALAIVGAAILLFTGFSTGQTIISIAGIVLFLLGIIAFGVAAATVAGGS